MCEKHIYFVVDLKTMAANLTPEVRAKRKLLAKPIVIDRGKPSSVSLAQSFKVSSRSNSKSSKLFEIFF